MRANNIDCLRLKKLVTGHLTTFHPHSHFLDDFEEEGGGRGGGGRAGRKEEKKEGEGGAGEGEHINTVYGYCKTSSSQGKVQGL